jgi:hypothetical protein
VPLFAEAHRDEASLLLLLGQFKEGWPKYEWRLALPTLGAELPGQRWRGDAVAERTILLQAERGIGDAIQFLRYVPMVTDRGGTVVLSLPPTLAGLGGSAIEAAAHVVPFGKPIPRYHCRAALISLPHALGATGIDDIPKPGRYLCPPQDCAERWQRELDSFRGLRVGLVWAGDAAHENDRNRSIPFSYLLPLFAIASVQFFSLQVGERSGDLGAANGRAVDLSPALADFSATAGAIDALDLVVTVDTAVAHLAGALGKNVWLLLPHIPDWRWLLERDDSPWYPTMRLFRQQSRGDWAGAIARVARELELLARSHDEGHSRSV